MHDFHPSPVGQEWLAGRLHDWPDGEGPMYRRLAQALDRLLHNGEVVEGARLPAERQLASALGVSRTTVASAYQVLDEQRKVARRHGSGTYVTAVEGSAPAPPRETVLLRSLERNEIFDGLLDPPRALVDLRAAALADSDALPGWAVSGLATDLSDMTHHHGYVPAGMEELREHIAARYSRWGLATDPEEVLVTSGAQQAISLIAMLHLRGDDRVVTEALTHTGAIDVFSSTGAQIQTVPVGSDGADINALVMRLDERPRMVYVIPSIHNPLGGVMPARHRRHLAAALPDRPDVVVVSDDTLCETWRDRRPPPPLASYPGAEGVLHIGSASKLFWGGLRIGWIRGPAGHIRRLARLKAMADLGTGIPGQLLALRLLAAGEDYADQRRAVIAGRGRHLEARLRDRLPEWRFTSPEGGLCLWITLPPGGDAKDLAMRAARHGIAITSGSMQSPHGRFGDHLRLPYGHAEPVLDQAVDRLAAAWRAGRPPPGTTRLDDLCVVV